MAYDSPSGYRERTTPAIDAPGLALGRVLEVQAPRARVHVGAGERWLAIDPSVDPALVERARQTGARVVIELGPEPVLAGVLMTARAVELDRKGDVALQVGRFTLDAEDVLLRTPRAFLRLHRQIAELFADELVARGRLLTRILGKAIKLN
jgi:hypothetical protein